MQTKLITEGWNDPRFTILEQKRIIPFVKSIEAYIVEAKLTPDQINQLFTTVTAKLQSAWKKAGSPDDSDAIADILRKAGVSDDVIAPAYKQLKLLFNPAAAPAGPAGKTPSGNQRVEPTLSQPSNNAAAPAAQSGQAAQRGQAAPAAPTSGGTGNAPKQSVGGQAAPAQDLDFNGIQKAVAKLSQPDAKELVTYIDSLNKPGAAPAAPASGQNKAAGDTYEKAKGDIRKVQSGTKPLPEPMAAGISSDIAKLAKGDKESGVAAADKIMKFAQRGMDVAKLQQAWMANSKAGERFLTQSVYFEITRMLKEHGLRWSDLGLRVHLVESTNKYVGISQL